ncbi:tRNA-uridine aminocarboxypropyltransferase [Alteromonas facilis]|uniref:tRNA-uridine aminocarboxypropyltransferase n=1 Tax=Alteromonas facilis TaxID=2048004 RepID=UPI000C287E12|nr:tRNA-uridine aminocarboxypropyltransferase [Alteromonas facilis]
MLKTSSRAYCSACHYPTATCVCSAVTQVHTSILVSILQDPSEQKHAKNTARLVPLIMPTTLIEVGIVADDFPSIRERISHGSNSVVLYPSAEAISLSPTNSQQQSIDHLIVLDGSWRKARKLWMNNPWLHQLPAIAITPEHQTRYRIRQAPDNNSLSTIEAIAHALHDIENIDEKPFMQVLEQLQLHWQGPQSERQEN